MVRALTKRGKRVVVGSPSPQGERDMIIDHSALFRMIPLDTVQTDTDAEGPPMTPPVAAPVTRRRVA
jgi:hypothetical protein